MTWYSSNKFLRAFPPLLLLLVTGVLFAQTCVVALLAPRCTRKLALMSRRSGLPRRQYSIAPHRRMIVEQTRSPGTPPTSPSSKYRRNGKNNRKTTSQTKFEQNLEKICWRAKSIKELQKVETESLQPQLKQFKQNEEAKNNSANNSTNSESKTISLVDDTVCEDAMLRGFRRMIQAYARLGSDTDAIRLLEQLKQMPATTKLKPTLITYNQVLNACSKAGNPENSKIIFDDLSRHYPPDEVSFTALLNAWAQWLRAQKGKSRNMLESQNSRMENEEDRVNYALAQMEMIHNLAAEQGRRNIVFFNTMLKVYLNGIQAIMNHGSQFQYQYSSSSNNKIRQNASRMAFSLAKRADDLMKHIKEQTMVTPDYVTYATLINIWTKCCPTGNAAPKTCNKDYLVAVERAHELLEEMRDNGIDDDMPRIDKLRTCNTVLTAWGQPFIAGGLDRARLLLEEMEQGIWGSGGKPNVVSYTAYIQALARSGKAKEAEAVLRKMKEEQPDAWTWNAVLFAWARSPAPDAAEHAENIMSTMEARYMARLTNTRPDARSFGIVLNAWAQSKRDHTAGLRADKIMAQMNERTDLVKTATHYNLWLRAWVASRHYNAGCRATEILETMKESNIQPNLITFTNAIQAHAFSGHSTAGEQAEKLLEEMETNYGLKPTQITYNAVLNAWARSNSEEKPERMEDLMERMSRDPSVDSPNTFSHNMLINAWARSKRPDRARKALDILVRMDSSQADLITFNSVLHASLDDFQTALETMKLLVETYNLEPDHITYGTLLKACGTLKGHELVTWTEKIFQKCAKENKITDSFLRSLQSVAPPELYERLVESR